MKNKNETIPTPCFVLEEDKLRANLSLIKNVSERAGVEIILAFKGFAMWSAFPIIKEYVYGATASSLHEVLLCNEYMETKSHTYAVAYEDHSFDQIVEKSSHLTFNSIGQLERFKDRIGSAVSVGLRINPEESDVEVSLYNPASPYSRLGVTEHEVKNGLPPIVEGLHAHVLCESDSFALEKVLKSIEEKFEHLLTQIKWLNLGGGHLMTREGYDVEHLIQTLKNFKDKHDIHLTLEPGSAFAWETGFLKTSVLDIVERSGVKTAIINASFTCHMPDCLEMPYRPNVLEADSDPTSTQYSYRLGGVSCLAGDYLETYGFDEELSVGDTVTFLDMMHYTMVKTTTFNGIQHPAIGMLQSDGQFKLIREFGYQDFKEKLS